MPPSNKANISLTANPSGLMAGLSAGLKMISSFAKSATSSMSALHLAPSQSQRSGWTQHAIGTAVGMYTRRGIDMLVDQGKEIFSFNDKLVRFGIAAKMSGVQLDYVGRMARKTSDETGLSAVSVLDAARAYVDLAGASNFSAEKMKILSKAGQASEATGADLAGMMYQLTTSMKVADNQMENTMGGLINQAKEGAIEAKQMAKEFGAMLPLYAKFGVIGRQGAVQAGAMFQVIRDGYNTASEAGNGITRIFAGLRTHASKFEEHGVRIFDIDNNGVRKARHFSDIFRDIRNSDLMKNPELLKKAFGRTEAWSGFEILVNNLEKLKQMEVAGMANGVIDKDLLTYTESAAGRISIAMEKTKNAVAEAFTPERIEMFTKAVEDALEKVGPLAEAVGKLGEGLGWLYSAGKSMKGFLGANGQVREGASDSETYEYMMQHGMMNTTEDANNNFNSARIAIAKQRREANEFKKRISDLMPDGKTTPASNREAIKTMLNSAPGSDLRQAAESYVTESGLSVKQIKEIQGQISTDQVNSGRSTPEGEQAFEQIYSALSGLSNTIVDVTRYVTGRSDHVNMFEGSTRVDFISALNRFTDAVNQKSIVISVDGEAIANSVHNAPKVRRR